MNLVELTEFLIKSVAKEPELMEIKSTDEADQVLIEVLVSENDMGRVIGRGGQVANSIRTLVQASSYLQENKRVRINIDSKK